MTTPSKLAPAFLSVFGLPFAGMGLFAAYTFLQAPDQPLAQRIGAAVFASVFTIIGAGLIFGSWYGYSLQKKQSQVELDHPGAPWLWRTDWAAGRVESNNKKSAIAWWVGAVLVNMLSAPISLFGLYQSRVTADPKILLLVGFELVGLILIFAAIRATLRFERFGKTFFEMNALPFSPGARVAGSIHFQLNTSVPHGVDLSLSCIRRVITRTGNNRTTEQVPLWEDSKNVPAAALLRNPRDTSVPVEFVLPPNAFQTDHDNLNDQVVWMLKARADVPGVDYSDEFEVPVFRTASSPSSAEEPGSRTRIGSLAPTSTMAPELSDDVPEPAHHRVVVNDSPDGLQFYFSPGRNIGRAILIVSLAAAISALFYALFGMHPRPPLFAFVVVGVLDFFLILATIHALLSATRIIAGNGMVSWRRSVLGIGSGHQLQISDVDSVLVSTSIQQASSSGGTLYSLVLKSKSGKTYTLIDDIENRQEARWIVSQIEKRSGLPLSTQVEVKNFMYGPPPQPMYASATGATPPEGKLRIEPKTRNNWSPLVGFIVFGIWVGFVGHMVTRMPHTPNAPPSNNTTARAFARTAAMKNASLDEVRTWPAQQQAEELLARAVDHDSGATQAIEQGIPVWFGHLRLTANLRQMEARARYSSDLRVRRSEADLELLLYGWSKDPSTVELLMGLAKSDAASRPAALYSLGILAGDGIESDRAHQFILDYARNNSDPSARQWATEGLSFVGSDAALDELFDIFTHDPSFAVRDRAGCNVSDCGIFERKQRLKMVPRLIDLVSGTDVDPRMRTWSFMALREITDENLPDDPAAWSSWYKYRADAKRSQFAALDWWQVRGDN